MKRSDPARERLLTVGRELFCSRGYDGVSVREITAEADANLGAITYHFGSKEALYHAVIDSVADGFANRLSEIAATPAPALDRIDAVVRMGLNKFVKGPRAPAILLRELANEGPLPPPITRMMKRNVGIVSGIIRDGQKDGTVRAGDATLLALSVISQPMYFNIAGRGIEQALGLAPKDPAVWSRVVEHVVKSVRQTIAKHPGKT